MGRASATAHRPSRRVELAEFGALAVLLGLAAILVFGFLVFEGFLPIAIADVQNLLSSLDHPTPLTDAAHFLLGFIVGLFGYVLVTHGRRTSGRRIDLTSRRPSAAKRHAAILLVVVVGAGIVTIAFKEFLFDPFFEGASLLSGWIDLGGYILGIGAGVGAGLMTE